MASLVPIFRLRPQEIDRVRPVRRWRPPSVDAPGGSLTRRAHARVAADKSGVSVFSWEDMPPRQEVLCLTRRLALDLRSLLLL
jgi:hypothetical protein